MTTYTEAFRYDIRCVVYAPAAGRLGWLPDPKSITVGFVADGDPSLIVEVYKNSPASELLKQPCELAVEIWNQAANKWIEPPNGRFLALNWEEDSSDPLGVLKFTCPGIAYLLDKVKIRKPKEDDALVKRADEVEEWYNDTKREYESALSDYKRAWEPVRKHYNLTGAVYVESFFPKSTSKQKIPSKSVLLNVSNGDLYHYWASGGGKWYRFDRDSVYYDNRPEITETARDLIGWRKNFKHVTAVHNRAQHAARNATRNKRRPLLNSHASGLLAMHWKEIEELGGGRLKGIKRTFTWGNDSKGRPWPERRDHEVSIGESMKSVVDRLVDAGEISWQTRGRNFDVLPQGDLEVWHGDKFALRLGLDITEAPDRSTRTEFASSFIVAGDEDYVSAFAITSPGPWGAWEESFSISGVRTYARAKKETDGYRASRSKQVKVESTRGLIIRDGSPRPMIDYLPHHSIMVEGPEGLERRKVMQITLTRNEQGNVSGNVVLDARFMNRALNWSKSLSKISNGQDTIVGNAGPGLVQIVPSVIPGPGSLTADPFVDVDPDGTPHAVVRLSWSGYAGTTLPAGEEGVDSSDEQRPPE